MWLTLAYDRRTAVTTALNGSALDFAANVRRMPVSFEGTINDTLRMRQLMIALHEVVISDHTVSSLPFTLDPVITVHPDEVFLEAFSTDQSAYARLSASMDAFDVAEAPTYGTTNVDFTFALRAAMQDMRSSRRTTFTVGAGGFNVQTQIGGGTRAHFEQKVNLPDSWVKGFLQVQSALVMRAYTFDVRPVDLLSVIHYFMENNARKPPRGLRFEFRAGEPIAAVLEPWNTRFPLHGTTYDGYERSVRLWGRKRLELLTHVLPYADRVTVGVLGRGLPHFYICHSGPYKFTLVLSGWVRNDWSETGALDLLAPAQPVDGEMIAAAYNVLTSRLAATRADIEAHALLEPAQAEAALFRLCREGRAMYDPTTRRYRSRELFAEPLDATTILAPDPRIEQARRMVAEGRVEVDSVAPSTTHKREIKIIGRVRADDATYNVNVAVDLESRTRFAQCECNFFRDNLMNRGPCEHILALRTAAEEHLSEIEKSRIIEA